MAKMVRLLMTAALLAAATPAHADEVPPTPESLDRSLPCPSVYGTWETAFVIGRFGPEPLQPGEWWGGLVMKVTIGKDKAVLTRMKNDFGDKTLSVYKRDEPPPVTDDYFFALNASGAQVGARIIDGELADLYPDRRCLLEVGTAPRAPGLTGLSTYIMRKVK
mgnify:CR=1 FL=1